MVKCRVLLLDQEPFSTEVSKGALGKELFELVKQKLQLSEEADYFSISYKKGDLRYWLNVDKAVDKQIDSKSSSPHEFAWEVKFYPPAPEILNEDLTRYFLVLQLRKDLQSGRLPASFHTLAVLSSYTAQGELGDFDKNVHIGIDYLRQYPFAPKQSDELLMRIADLHRNHRGLSPAEADLYFLENAKKISLYGTDLYPVKDGSGRMNLLVGVSASGLYVYDEKLRLDSFKWPRILKISYKRNIFFVKVRPGEFEKHEKTTGFKLPSPKLAKRLWRIAVEHHQFFRLNQPELTDSKSLAGFGPRKWRMSGRTQAQLKSAGTPRKGDFSRSNSYMSQDGIVSGHGYSTGTLPLPAQHRDQDMSGYNTFAGRRNEKMVLGYDDQGRPIYDGYLDDSTLSRGQDGRLAVPGAGNMYRSEDDLLGEQGYNAETGALSDMAATIDRRHNGQTPNDYESYDDINKQNQAPPQPAYPYGVGELPLPFFCSESAGVTPEGVLDLNAPPLGSHERSEKRISQRALWQKNPHLTVDSNANVDDQLLLDAILAVTGLDPRLCVDKIVIKTEEEAS